MAWRKDGGLDFVLPVFGDGAGRSRVADEFSGDSGTVTVRRDGSPLWTSQVTGSAIIPVPDGQADCLLTVEARRDNENWPLWTNGSAAWAFRSSSAGRARRSRC